MIVSDEKMEKALRFMAETDEQEAQLKADMMRAESKWKSTRDTVFSHIDGSVADRNAEAAIHPDTLNAQREYFNAVAAHGHVYNKRRTAIILIDVWRSENASKRYGNLT